MKRNNEEHKNQVSLFKWIDSLIDLHQDPEVVDKLKTVYSTTRGNTNKRTGAYLKAEGVRKGIPDINVDYGNFGFHGLRIELKSKTGRLTRDQIEVIDRLTRNGYLVEVCVGWIAARDSVIDYLELPENLKD